MYQYVLSYYSLNSKYLPFSSFFDNYLSWYARNIILFMDNCGILYSPHYISFIFFFFFSITTGGTNKSNFVVNSLCAEPIRIGRFLSFTTIYLPKGHSKTNADKMFANIATSLTVNDYYNHLYVYSYLSVFFYSKLTYFSSMI